METYKFSINDWVIKTQLLTLAERGMLKDLIDQVVYFEVALSAAKVQMIRERLTKEEGEINSSLKKTGLISCQIEP